jgi:hypothetical protein
LRRFRCPRPRKSHAFHAGADHAAEQAEEIEALQAILMDDISGARKGFTSAGGVRSRAVPTRRCGVAEVEGQGPEGLSTDSPCYQIVIRPEGEEDPDGDYPGALTEPRLSGLG